MTGRTCTPPTAHPKGRRCVGVTFQRDGKLTEVRANREVIVSCGAVQSPQLLELSGIGDPAVLQKLGILKPDSTGITNGQKDADQMWQKLANIQEQLARQSADTGVQALEARTLAKQALELARETAGRLTVSETRLSEVTLQRTQLEELMQSLSRSRDENLVVDIESALRMAQQQAQLTGSVEPLLAALKSADQRVVRAASTAAAHSSNALRHSSSCLEKTPPAMAMALRRCNSVSATAGCAAAADQRSMRVRICAGVRKSSENPARRNAASLSFGIAADRLASEAARSRVESRR